MMQAGTILAKWKSKAFLGIVLKGAFFLLGLTAVLCAFLLKFVALSPVAVAVIAAIFALFIFLCLQPLHFTKAELIRNLDSTFPALEHSTGLLYRQTGDLNLLEQFQQERAASVISTLPDPFPVIKKIKMPALLLFATLLFSFLILQLPDFFKNSIYTNAKQFTNSAKQPEIIPSEIIRTVITVSPPGYTGKRTRQLQNQMSFEVEEGGTATWLVDTKQVNEINFIWNEKNRSTFSQKGKDKFGITKSFTSSGFYQFEINGKLSDVYAVEVIKDHFPSAKLKMPATHVTIGFGEQRRVSIAGFANDDYGIVSAQLFTTIATGQGEGVKFRENNFSLQRPGGAIVYNFSKTLDLNSLKMIPGEELFFFIEVKDAKGQVARTEAQTISIKDTADLMSVQGFSTGVNLMPEYFRSQRQIIMDTEKLLREKPGLTEQEFKQRSNNIGVDQKLLRLRYGKFLGEENEEEIGGNHEHDEHDGHDHSEAEIAEDFSNKEKILESVSHVHDRAEDATFFDAKTKTQLKNTLTEMWNAELKLRTFDPQKALPYEYKALVLLKDLQQQDRAYVAKTKYTTPPLAHEKRLTGDLSKTVSPVWQNKKDVEDKTGALKIASGIIQNIKPGVSLTNEEKKQVLFASSVLMENSQKSPKQYLPGVRAARNILSANKATSQQINALGSTLQFLLGDDHKPQKNQQLNDNGLGKSYFENLKRNNR